MAKTFLGLQYPLVMTHRGIMAQKTGIDQVKADLLQLILTNPGERVMLPNYGIPLRTLAFEPNDATLVKTAQKMISDAIATWEPRIVIPTGGIVVTNNFPANQLAVTDTGAELPHILGVQINFYDPQDISQINALVVELPLAGVT